MNLAARLWPGVLALLALWVVASCGGAVESTQADVPDTSAPALDGATASVEAQAPPAPELSEAGADATTTSPSQEAGLNNASSSGQDAASPADATIFGSPMDAADFSDVAPSALPSSAECLTGGHVLWVDGDPGAFWITGIQKDDVGSNWSASIQTYYAQYDNLYIIVAPPPSVGATDGWRLYFNTANTHQPLMTGIVYDVMQTVGMPFLSYQKSCASAYGTFRIDDLVAVDSDATGSATLLSFTAVFSVTCEGTQGVLRGCVHF